MRDPYSNACVWGSMGIHPGLTFPFHHLPALLLMMGDGPSFLTIPALLLMMGDGVIWGPYPTLKFIGIGIGRL